MGLLEEVAEHTPVSGMTSPLHLPDFAFGGSFDDAACAFYDIASKDSAANGTGESEGANSRPITAKARRLSSAVPFVASFEHLSELTTTCVYTSIVNGSSEEEKHSGPHSDALHLTFVQGGTISRPTRVVRKTQVSLRTGARSSAITEWFQNVKFTKLARQFRR